jgi:hypothetical protein
MNSLKKKRVSKELHGLNYTVDEDTCTINVEYKEYQVKFILKSNFPFEPPSDFFVNEKRISYSPNCFPKRLFEEYCKIKKECPCCSSILCSNNWGINLTLINIIDEYIIFANMLKRINTSLVLKKIKLPDDMINEIISFY